MRPTVYNSPGIGAEESLYIKTTIYASATIYKEWEDPQEWDENDVPPNMSLDKVPKDSVGWGMTLDFGADPGAIGTDSVGWGMDLKEFGADPGAISTDSVGWGMLADFTRPE